jgi:WD repeat-containing protein 64
MWFVGEFIENLQESLILPESLEDNKNNLQMIVCWKAHNGPIVDMTYLSINKTLATASTDESVRVWWGNRGRFIGFYGQIKHFIIPLDDDSDLTQPYDISEQPIYSKVKARTEKQLLDTNKEYPLIVDRNRLLLPKIQQQQQTNLSRQPTLAQQEGRQKTNLTWPSTLMQQEGKQKTKAELLKDKYFRALIKPKHDFDKINTINISRDRKEGAVFSSLPLYKENKTNKFDVKMLLMENPLRLNNEISYLGMTRVNFIRFS